jgi:hypothetical protein
MGRAGAAVQADERQFARLFPIPNDAIPGSITTKWDKAFFHIVITPFPVARFNHLLWGSERERPGRKWFVVHNSEARQVLAVLNEVADL